MQIIPIFVLLLIPLLLTGCKGQARPGSIIHERVVSRQWANPVEVQAAAPSLPPIAAGGHPAPVTGVARVRHEVRPASKAPAPVLMVETVTERTTIKQPSIPAAAAKLATSTQGITAEIPSTYKPDGPPTPVDNWLGYLAWASGLALAAGIFLQVCRFFPGIPFLAAMPKGVARGLMVSGGGLLLIVTFFDRAPVWLLMLMVGFGVLVAVVVGQWDNIKHYFAGMFQQQPTEPVK